jgi:hypothetical protein
MAWLAGAAGTSGAAGGAAAGAAGSAAGAGTAAASTGAASAAGAGTGSAIGAGTSGAATSAAGSAGAAEAAKGIGSSAAKDFIKDTAKDTVQSTINNEINKEDSVNPISNTFDPSGISSDANNKSNIQSASFQKHEVKKPSKEQLPGVDLLHGIVDGVNGILTSDETKKENVTDVSSDKPKSSLSRFNATMRSLGQELGAYAKEEGKNLVSQAIASSAQPQQVNPVSPGFTGAQISSDEHLKENIEEAGGIIPMMAQIDSYLYNYKPEAQEEYAGTGMMNNDNNLGVMAQELQENPLTAPAVKTDEKGNLALDTGRLTSINTAMIAELCKKVMELEGQMYGRS